MADVKTSPLRERFIDIKLSQDSALDAHDLFRYIANTKSDAQYVIISKKTNPEDIISLLNDTNISSNIFFGNRAKFLELCMKCRNVHLLKYCRQKKYFRWIESNIGADINCLRKNIKTVDTFDFKSEKDRPVTIIFSGYGTGKTVFLKRIQADLLETNYSTKVLILSAVDIAKFCEKYQDINLENFEIFFKLNLNNEEINLMFDNIEYFCRFTQIIDLIERIHLNNRNVKLWITCSNHAIRNTLESKLGTFCCYFSPITKEIQIDYLKGCWEITSDDHDEYIEDVLRTCNKWYWKDACVNNATKTYSNSFNNNLLHLKMIARMFNPSNKIKLTETSILDVYEHFVRSYYIKKKAKAANIVELCKKFNCKLNIYSESELLPGYKNVTNYLAAKWYSKNFQNFKEEYVMILKSKSFPWSFYHFFNCFLAQGHPVHTAVLNNWYLELGATNDNINDKDAGGRTPLHLVHQIDSLRGLFRCDPDVTITDDILQCTPIEYYDFNCNLSCMNYLLQHSNICKEIDLTLKLNETEVTKRLWCSIVKKKLPHYVKLICQKFQELKICPETLLNLFIDMPPDISMMVLSRVKATDISYVCINKKTSLFYAVKNNHFESVKYLIEKLGFDIYHKCCENTTIIREAIEHQRNDIAKYLLEQVSDINMTYGDDNSSAFTDSCRYKNFEVFKFLINKGVNTNQVLYSGESPMQLACNSGSINITRYFLQNMKHLNISYEVNYEELLHGAVRSTEEQLVRLILQEVKDINKVIQGTTALHIAVEITNNTRKPIIKLLLDAKADINAVDFMGNLPLFNMHHNNDFEVVRLLSSYKYKVSHINNSGETVIHTFTKQSIKKNLPQKSRNYIINAMLYLIFIGADINASTPSGDTALHLACRNSNIIIARCLVKLGAKLDVTNNNGETPLHLACLSKLDGHYNNFKTCLFLINRGVDVNAKTNSGQTPLMYAAKSFPKNIDRLIKQGANIFCKDNKNKNLVHYFAEYGLLNKLELIWKLGLRHDTAVDDFGRTGLHYAAFENNFECFEYLINFFETDANILDRDGNSAVNLTLDKRYRHILRKYRTFTCCLV